MKGHSIKYVGETMEYICADCDFITHDKKLADEHERGQEESTVSSELKLLLSAALDEAFELIDDKYVENGDTGFAGQFFVDGEWYCCKWGCDSLQKFIDVLQGR